MRWLSEPENKIHSFRLKNHFTWPFMLVGLAILSAGFYVLLTVEPALGALLIMLSGIVFSAAQRIEFDLQRKEFFLYLSLAGFKNGKRTSFEELQHFALHAHLPEGAKHYFSLHLVHSQGKSQELCRYYSYKQIKALAVELAEAVSMPIEDHTQKGE
ncbi:hypothetical protein QWY31_03165 [Cytophagales bacterium LB-30]|uniref:Uncharacterized protein n=1 Tax=Shiella aurantiaca TaxID=3058365 RepID=A0ABT8F285_9BACT|nr:hypothetical protein [Shiella aurantiaca]MDN4164483.1 hypothetical protein [Shiella aurantiaca]